MKQLTITLTILSGSVTLCSTFMSANEEVAVGANQSSWPNILFLIWVRNATTLAVPMDNRCLQATPPARSELTTGFMSAISNLIVGRPVIPQYGLLNCDPSPTKKYLMLLTETHNDFRFYEMAFGKRQLEELYDMRVDTDWVNNLAEEPL